MKLKELFDTDAKRNAAIAAFRQLKTHVGWQYIKDIFQGNVDVLTQQILDGVEGATEEEMNLRRWKLKAYKEILDAPDYWIERLSAPEKFIEDSDPYFTAEDIIKARQDTV